ncbi:MAG TPA: thiamine pyrophosphate-dependent enzyme, partial [Acidimicrobiales bacterium]|nr:thiamine pyrophosphate-dependent enzyme [Acidimicrobiales bacterium]
RVMAAGQRGLIIAGRGAGDAETVSELAELTGWPVMADPLSGCRRPGAIAAADALLRTPTAREWQPDVVIRLGSPWASRALNDWLAALACPQVLVDPFGRWAAPDRSPWEVVQAGPASFCSWLASAVRSTQRGAAASSWSGKWAAAEQAAQRAIDQVLSEEQGFSGPGLARALASEVAPATLFVSSSMPVRDLEWWSRPEPGLRVLANRGANGIDGVVATALGVATGVARGAGRVTAFIGDLAFVYDAGALLWAAERGADLDLVVADNDGGGIFSFLPQAVEQPRGRFERLWGTPHHLSLGALASAFGAESTAVDNVGELRSVLRQAHRPGVRVIVARTSRAGDVAVQRRIHEAVKVAVARLQAG